MSPSPAPAPPSPPTGSNSELSRASSVRNSRPVGSGLTTRLARQIVWPEASRCPTIWLTDRRINRAPTRYTDTQPRDSFADSYSRQSTYPCSPIPTAPRPWHTSARVKPGEVQALAGRIRVGCAATAPSPAGDRLPRICEVAVANSRSSSPTPRNGQLSCRRAATRRASIRTAPAQIATSCVSSSSASTSRRAPDLL